MILVLDVSAAVELLMNKQRAAAFSDAVSAAEWVIAPDLYVTELANTFWKYYRAGVLSGEACLQLASDGIGLVDTFVPAHEVWKEALAAATRHDHAVYDMVYLVLARRNVAALATCDGRMSALAGTFGVELVT